MEINLLFLLKSRKLFLLPFSINIHTVFNTKNTEEIVTLLTSPKIPRQSDNRWIATNFKIIEKISKYHERISNSTSRGGDRLCIELNQLNLLIVITDQRWHGVDTHIDSSL